MPTPRKGETRSKFVSRCIPIVMKEGNHKDAKKAGGKCGGIYEQWQKKRSKGEESLSDNELFREFHLEYLRELDDMATKSDVDKLRELERM